MWPETWTGGMGLIDLWRAEDVQRTVGWVAVSSTSQSPINSHPANNNNFTSQRNMHVVDNNVWWQAAGRP